MKEKIMYISTVIHWLNPLTHFVGLGIAIWAFRRCQKKGYLVIMAYFILVLFSLLAMPRINRARAIRQDQQINEQMQKKIETEVYEAMDRVMKKHGIQNTGPLKVNIYFPFGPILLVVGLWMIAKKEQIIEQIDGSDS
jgi:uncharacterized membrane protein YeiB